MTLIEAIKSGRPFRRKVWSTWLSRYKESHKGGRQWSFMEEDMLCDDWEIEEKAVTITRSQFEKAMAHTAVSVCEANGKYSLARGSIAEIAEKLGLEEP